MRIRPRLISATADEPALLLASGEGEAYARGAERALRTQAMTALTARTDVHRRRLGAPMPDIALTDARARWGSCKQAADGRAAVIRYSWRLVLAPPPVLDYVAAHECAHLLEANHGAAFWRLVQGLYGDHTPSRAWLKRHGARVHAVGGG